MGTTGNQPLRLGVTGGAGSGKSVVCQRLLSHGVPVILTDELARRAVMPGMPAYEAIVDYFGPQVLAEDGSVNRARLRSIIIEDASKKAALESFVHPEVFRLMNADIRAAGQKGVPLVAVEVPLLFETGMEGYFDYIVMVRVGRQERMQRLMARDRISREDAEALMRIQLPEAEKEKKSDFVIDNAGMLDQTLKSVDHFYQELMARIKND